MRAFLALLRARNKEFLRDRATLVWNIAFPFAIIFGFALAFSGSGRELYKVGVVDLEAARAEGLAFLQTRHVTFVPVADPADGRDKVRHHQLDMLLAPDGERPVYWVNPSNPRGYVMERVLWGSTAGGGEAFEQRSLEGRQIRYIDWLLPGVLAMNMMFSSLFGVGYVMVRYRKGGILRRLKAAPISALQFLAAQVASRLWLVLAVTAVLFVGADLVLDLYMRGSLLYLAAVFALGALCLISLGLVIASRTQSQELAGGMLNLLTLPMIFLSGVWFSLEGVHPWLQTAAQALPLTHLIAAARSIMVDGAGLAEIAPHLGVLALMTAAFLALGAWLFRWE